jgi:predicted Zn-dependent protease
MTRDGTFLIEDGKLTTPIKNLRFTQSAVESFGKVLAVGRERRYAGGEESPTLVPALLVEDFHITGQTR